MNHIHQTTSGTTFTIIGAYVPGCFQCERQALLDRFFWAIRDMDNCCLNDLVQDAEDDAGIVRDGEDEAGQAESA